MRNVRRVVLLLVAVALAVAVLAPVAEAAERPALKQARKHAATHARCLGRTLPTRLQRTDSVRELQRYINRTWKQIRFPRGTGAGRWIPLARHCGWPESAIPMLRRVITRESGGNPRCSYCGHLGLLQIARYHTAVDLFNPNTNLRYGYLMWRRLGWAPWRSTAW